MASITSLPPYPGGKVSRYTFYKRVDGPQIRPGLFGEEKNPVPIGNRIPAVKPAARRCIDYTDIEKSGRSLI
jgi:hypothetical protein